MAASLARERTLPGVFLSHSGRDGQWSRFVARALEEAHFEVFYSPKSIADGVRWQERLVDALGRCEAVLVLMSPNWARSPWCIAEYTTAVLAGKARFIVDTTNGRYRKDPRVYPLGIPELNAPPVRWSTRADDVDRIIKRVLASVSEETQFRLVHGRDPFPGLLAFDVEDAGAFFGRRQEVLDIVAAVDNAPPRRPGRRCRFIVGPSGSGKSSILRAGVIAHLRRLQGDTWRVPDPIMPG